MICKCKRPIRNVPEYLRDVVPRICNSCATETPEGIARAEARAKIEDPNELKLCGNLACLNPKRNDEGFLRLEEFARYGPHTSNRHATCKLCEAAKKQEEWRKRKARMDSLKGLVEL